MNALTFSRNLASDSESALLIADARQNTNAQSNSFSPLLDFFFCPCSFNPTTVPFPSQFRITSVNTVTAAVMRQPYALSLCLVLVLISFILSISPVHQMQRRAHPTPKYRCLHRRHCHLSAIPRT